MFKLGHEALEGARHDRRCCCCSVAQSYPTLCDPMDCSIPGLPVPQCLPEFAKVCVPFSLLILWCPLLLHPQSFPASGTFPMSCLFSSDDQNIGASASASVLPVNIQGWPPLRLTSLISLLSKGLLGIFCNTTVRRHQFFDIAFFMVQLSQLYVTTGKTIVLTTWAFVGRIMSLLFNILSIFVIVFLPRSNCPLISWLQSLYAVILEPKKRKSVTTIFPFYLPCSNGTRCHDLRFFFFKYFVLSWLFPLFLHPHQEALSSSSFSAIRVISSTNMRLLMFLPPILIPACNSSSLAFLMMHSAYKLNKQGDSRQPCCTPFSILDLEPISCSNG